MPAETAGAGQGDAEAPVAEAPGSALAENPTHTVSPGDTLFRIAAQYDLTVQALLNANDLPNPDFLEVGAGHQSAAEAARIHGAAAHPAGFAAGALHRR